MTADEIDQIGHFSEFISVTPRAGSDFTVLSTGCVYCNHDSANWSLDWDDDGIEDSIEFYVGPITVPAGVHSFTFDYYYFSTEIDRSGGTYYDPFTVKLNGSTIISIDAHDAGINVDIIAGHTVKGTGWKTKSAEVNPGDTIIILFYLEDTEDGQLDSAAILDNFKWEEPVWVRTQEMTCKRVWINEDNNFQFSFIYPYANNNWVKIYDVAGNLVYEIDMPYYNPNIIVDLPDGMYKVKTFHDQVASIQEFMIGKP